MRKEEYISITVERVTDEGKAKINLCVNLDMDNMQINEIVEVKDTFLGIQMASEMLRRFALSGKIDNVLHSEESKFINKVLTTEVT